jgi:hypothetical protein
VMRSHDFGSNRAAIIGRQCLIGQNRTFAIRLRPATRYSNSIKRLGNCHDANTSGPRRRYRLPSPASALSARCFSCYASGNADTIRGRNDARP